MASAGIDIEEVRRVLRDATSEGGPFSMRGLSKAAGLNRDAVYDIIAGRNLNPTMGQLSALAEAMESDLSIFGLQTRTIATTVAALQRAIAEALPDMPSRGHQRQAEYLAGVVADALELPQDLPANRRATRQVGNHEEGAPPPSPTS